MEELLVVAPPVIEGNRVNRLGSQETTVTGQQIEDLNALYSTFYVLTLYLGLSCREI
jgi:hypothetical protein